MTWPIVTAASERGNVGDRNVIGGSKASIKPTMFDAVDTAIGNPKTTLSGTCHPSDFVKYAHRYLAKAQSRFNRRSNLAAKLPRPPRVAMVAEPQAWRPCTRLRCVDSSQKAIPTDQRRTGHRRNTRRRAWRDGAAPICPVQPFFRLTSRCNETKNASPQWRAQICRKECIGCRLAAQTLLQGNTVVTAFDDASTTAKD